MYVLLATRAVLATGTQNGTLTLYDVENAHVLLTQNCGAGVTALHWVQV